MTRKWQSPRGYRMTVSTFVSDKERREFNEYEIHYKARRRGKIPAVRQHLAIRGVKHFQQAVYRLSGRWVPLKRIRISFEREAPVRSGEATIQTEARRMTRERKRWKAEPFTTKTLTYYIPKSSLRKRLASPFRRVFKR